MITKSQSGLYEIRNNMTGGFYLGSSCNIQNRISRHFSLLRAAKHHNRHLQSAWNKYGEQAFSYKIILICATENLLMYEQIAIDGIYPTYNLAKSVTAPFFGRKHTEKAKQRTQEFRDKMKIRNAGRITTKETREKLSKSKLGRIVTEDMRKNMSAAQAGKPRRKNTDEQKARKSVSAKAGWIKRRAKL